MRSMKNWLAGLLGQRTKTEPCVATRPRLRLVLECLEDRTAPAVLTVTTVSDHVGHSGVSLRDAIATANADAQTGAADTIVFNSGLAGSTITLSQGPLKLSGVPAAGAALIKIDASALAGGIVIDANQASRVLQVDSGVQAELVQLTLQNGRALDGAGGGGIFNDSAAVLTLSNSAISDNTGLGDGGGILNMGTLYLQQESLVTRNNADYDGGIANYGTLTIAHSTISYNTARYAGGIGNWAASGAGTMVIRDSQVTNNTAALRFGGIINDRGQADLSGTTISDNRADGDFAGGFFNEGADVTMTDCIVSNNTAASDAGGILNTAFFVVHGYDGQITDVIDGTLTLVRCTISGNHADSSGGGLVNAWPQDLDVWNLYRPGEPFPATMTISDSTLNGNTAGVNGGAIAVFGGALAMERCTVNGNAASYSGGAVFIDPAVAKIISSTFSGNSAPLGADLVNLDSAVIIIASSIRRVYNQGGTVADPIANLLAQVAALNLSSGLTNSLMSKLQMAQHSLASGNSRAAVNQLNTFINQLNALVHGHRLSEINAGSLIIEADNLVEFIS